jgi:heavy metal sensor kinase
MHFKSIKWRLQLWYGIILVAVLAGFGVTAYQLERNRVFRAEDDQLHRRLSVLMRPLHHDHGPGRDQPFREDRPPGEGPDELPPPEREELTPFTLPPQVAGLFDTNQPENFYFIIYARGGKEVARGGECPAVLAARNSYENLSKESQVPAAPGFSDTKPPPIWTEHGFRESATVMPGGEIMLVGCSVAPEQHELEVTAVNLTVIGAGILVIGLAGGWWFVGRALRPIAAISATAARISAGDLAQRIETVADGSELEQLAAVLNSTFARLETAFAQQKQFASDAAHELRTPVAVMLTQTQTALSRERDAASYRQTVEACQRAAQRMRRLIQSLLELTRFDAGQEALKRLKFDLAGTATDCLETVRTLAEERQVKLMAETQPLVITGDPERLAQVILNLLTNAIQYNRPGGEVRLKLEIDGRLAILQVSDTGKGIAAEDLPRVFERFYRAEKSRTGGGNSGLGLAICKAIVEAHGGTITAGGSPGVGATFVVRLPV